MLSALSMVSVFPYFLPTFAIPTEETLLPYQSVSLQKRCGAVGPFQIPQTSDWNANGLDDWLSTWWNDHTSDIESNAGGFAGAYGLWAKGDSQWNCLEDGEANNCDADGCDNRVLNDKGDSVRQAYYVLRATSNLHSYFTTLSQSWEVSAIGAALSKDKWATTFYHDKDDQSVKVLKEVFNLMQTIVGVATAFAGAPGGAASALFSGMIGIANPLIGQHQDDTFEKSADLGGILGEIVVDSLQNLTLVNNALMHGDNYQNTGDIRTCLSNGGFLVYPPDKNIQIEIEDKLNAFLIGSAVNQLYRSQKIFIMGGGSCGDGEGIGSGPQEAVLCRDNKAWYLYYWQEHDRTALNSHQWGWVNATPGMDQLGTGEYSGVTIQDIISSSLDSYNVAGYTYTADTARTRAQSALSDAWRNPFAQGPSWEGTFTIPVCDVSWAIANDVERKDYILQPYGHDSRPNWCGAVCGGDDQKTRDFISAANMWGFESPKHLCGGAVPY